MSKRPGQIWAGISHIATAYTVVGWWSYLSALLVAALIMATAWLEQLSAIQIFVLGLAGFALLVFVFERISAWRQRNQQRAGESPDAPEPPPYSDYIYEAVEYVIKKIDDCDSDNCYPRARHGLRQAAFTGKIKMYGKRELKEGYHSDLRTRIPQEYWDDQELNALSTSVVYTHHEHSQPEHGAGFQKIGSKRKKYWDIRVNMQEIKALWP